LLAVAMLALVASLAQAQPATCTGTKRWYAGKCRYPRDIQQLQAAEARRKAAEEERRKAEEEERLRQEQAEREAALQKEDRAACEVARGEDTEAAWNEYLSERPDGECGDEAKTRLAAIAEAAEAAQAPPTAQKGQNAADGEGEQQASSALWPLAYVGFAVGGAGLVTWGVAGGISVSRTSTIKDECPDDKCTEDYQDDLDDALLSAHVATVGLIVGGVGTALGVVAMIVALTESSGAEPEQQSGRLRVRPVVGLGTIGLQGQF
jgi:hypothetical protein